jgi:hypothetical protein
MKVAAKGLALPLAGLAAFVALSLAVLGAGVAHASGFGVNVVTSPGTNAPPTTLGPYHMYQFGADPQTECGPGNGYNPAPVTGVGLPANTGANGPHGSITFSRTLDHTRIPDCWLSWSNGYAGDVYDTCVAPTPDCVETTVTISLPPNTSAFYLYAEQNAFASYDITGTGRAGNNTASATVSVSGDGGAQYYGFYVTAGSLTSVKIDIDAAAQGFAVGEFGIAGPKLRKA